MLALLLATGLLIAACFALGQAIAGVCGWKPQGWAPALGYAVLMIVFGQAVSFRHVTLLLVIALAGVVASLALPATRRALREAGLDTIVLGLGLTLLAAIPFFASDYAGILGPNVSDDMSQHLTGAFWLRDDSGMLPVAAIGGNLVHTGYPLGPHGLAAAMSGIFGLGDVKAFSAVTLAVPALTGMVAFGIVREAPRVARWALAGAVGLGYLPVAYLAQGSFKEIVLAMLVLATTAAIGQLAADAERLRWPRGIPLGLMVGGAVYTYSYGALLWLAAVIVLVLAAEVLRRRELFSVMRRWAPAAVGLGLGLLVVVPEIDRIRAFRGSIFGQESLRNKGNLLHAVNPFETLGVWFSGDFRFNPDPRWPTIVFCAIALAALAGGLVWWWRRRAPALPAAVVAGIVVWAELALTVNIYNAAKGLLVLAPLVMACIGAPLAAAWAGGHNRLARVAGIVLLAGVAVSSFAVLRSAPVGLGAHDAEFAQIRELVRHQPTVFIDNDHFAQWELRGAKPLYVTGVLYTPLRFPQHPQKRGGLRVDIDSYGSPTLDKIDYVVLPGSAYNSQLPPNFELALRTPSYAVYRRVGPTPLREPAEGPGTPGAVVDCNSERGRALVSRYAWAGVLPRPVVQNRWQGSIARPGRTAQTIVTLPRGRWDVSLQYVSRVPVTVRAPGLDKKLAANFGPITSYWPAGTLTSEGGSLTLSVSSAERNWFGRLLGTPQPTRAALADGYVPLQAVAFTRHGATPQRVRAKDACGRYADWFAPAGSAMRGRAR